MISYLSFNRAQYSEMLQHVERHAPLEACGLLAGRHGRVEKVIPVRNKAQSPVRFLMDPHEQLQAFEWIDSQALDLVGIFHSHPAGPEAVSPTDIREAAYEVVHVVWSRPAREWRVRAFWIENGQVQEVHLSILEQ